MEPTVSLDVPPDNEEAYFALFLRAQMRNALSVIDQLTGMAKFLTAKYEEQIEVPDSQKSA